MQTTFQVHFSAFSKSDPFLSILQDTCDPHVIFPLLNFPCQYYFSYIDSFVTESHNSSGQKAPLEIVWTNLSG